MDVVNRACRRAIYKLDTSISDKIQIKVREATSSDPWGPTASEMYELVKAASTKAPIILSELWDRLDEDNWKHVYKALVVLDYLIKHGPDSLIRMYRQNLNQIGELQTFPFVEGEGNPSKKIREKSQQLICLITDPGKLAQERAKARRIHERVRYKDREYQHFFRGAPPDLSTDAFRRPRTGDADLFCDCLKPPGSAEEEASQLKLALSASEKMAAEEKRQRESDAQILQKVLAGTANPFEPVQKAPKPNIPFESPPEELLRIPSVEKANSDPCVGKYSSDLIGLSLDFGSGSFQQPQCHDSPFMSEVVESAGARNAASAFNSSVTPNTRRVVIPPPRFFCQTVLMPEEGGGDLLISIPNQASESTVPGGAKKAEPTETGPEWGKCDVQAWLNSL